MSAGCSHALPSSLFCGLCIKASQPPTAAAWPLHTAQHHTAQHSIAHLGRPAPPPALSAGPAARQHTPVGEEGGRLGGALRRASVYSGGVHPPERSGLPIGCNSSLPVQATHLHVPLRYILVQHHAQQCCTMHSSAAPCGQQHQSMKRMSRPPAHAAWPHPRTAPHGRHRVRHLPPTQPR